MSLSNASTAATEHLLTAVESALGLVEDPPVDGTSAGAPQALDPVCVGVSGGVDSSVLLWSVAVALRRRGSERPVLACHLNHNLRSPEETEADAEIVRDLARRVGATVVEDQVPAGFIAKRAQEEGGVEAAARRLRYTFFARVAAEHGAAALFLGHHQDDQVETLLLRLLTGGDPASFAGIPEERPLERDSSCRILRPFLSVAKAEIARAAADLGLEYAEDTTNAELDALRNRVRTLLVPRLPEVLTGARSRMEGTRRRGSMLRAFLDREIARFPWERGRTEEGPSLSAAVDVFAGVDPYIRLHLLIAAITDLDTASGRRVSQRFLSPLLGDDVSSVDEFTADAFGVSVTIRQGRITLSHSAGVKRPQGFCFVKDLPVEKHPGITINYRVGRREAAIYLSSDGLTGPIVLRNRRPGDSLVREGGRRTVKRILIDIGVPQTQRESVPVVEDREGVAAVLGAAVGSEDALRYNVRHGQASLENVIFTVNQE